MIVPKLIATDYLVPKTFPRYCIVILTFWTGINNNNMGTKKRVYLNSRFTSTYSSRNFKTIYFVVMVTIRGVLRPCQTYEKEHCVKKIRIRSFFWSVFSSIQSKCGKMRTRKSPVFGHFSRSGAFCDIYMQLPIFPKSSI